MTWGEEEHIPYHDKYGWECQGNGWDMYLQ